MEFEDENFYYSKLRNKKKSQTYLPKLEYLELKPRRHRQGKCGGVALEVCDFIEKQLQIETLRGQKTHTLISNEIWLQLSNYIAPEDVQRYSLICSQSANSVNSCSFWLQIYRRYCQKSRRWILQLPKHLQMEQIKDCDRNTLRQRVIEALFYCYLPFKRRLQTHYTLETLKGRTYVSSWHKQIECAWIMCYKFKLGFPLSNKSTCLRKSQIELENNDNELYTGNIVDDWECLADEKNNNLCTIEKSNFSSSIASTTNDLDGVSLLVVCCDRFIPFPSDIVYSHGNNLLRLANSRELLSTDMRSINLELDFIYNAADQIITVNYAKIQKFKVIPWWHPEFRILNKCI